MRGELTPQTLGNRIRQAMTSAQMRPERLAAEVGCSLDTLNRYIKGSSSPSAIDVWKIARVTGTPFGWFAGDGEIPIPEELDRAVIVRLLDTLEQRNRATEDAVAQLRALLQGA